MDTDTDTDTDTNTRGHGDTETQTHMLSLRPTDAHRALWFVEGGGVLDAPHGVDRQTISSLLGHTIS